MKLVVGLGNPGSRYLGTRHNVGYRVVGCFAARNSIPLDGERFESRFGPGSIQRDAGEPVEVAVLEPLTWMNRSGAAVAQAIRGLGIEEPSSDLLVVFDDVDLPTGRLRLRPHGGSGGHRGLADVIEALDRSDFARLRFGVGRPEGLADTADWVLAPFSAEEEVAVRRRVEAAAEAIEAFLLEGIVPAMNRFNTDPASES
ncbi:MAG: aminoacyl-tRNA hydrolase [Myxococcota bacterium]|mgnify:CR=1 FL=1|nr:aminoacyl-tRNA hydrolase [Deltaproteobacteria bacterium]MCP4240954.1 aminoacyl-tRNA hydrolase [bacterium]MDP6074959.1 aminoacyl-tRNA hydrolase [Myxococcota bacterium]MDP6243107.1 aminoacyl-tRNA hydrolase [Myxococcota bacterium]MDP7076282.1 aminoacyl-tRNA hydrolase [Myxococcota bacterium]